MSFTDSWTGALAAGAAHALGSGVAVNGDRISFSVKVTIDALPDARQRLLTAGPITFYLTPDGQIGQTDYLTTISQAYADAAGTFYNAPYASTYWGEIDHAWGPVAPGDTVVLKGAYKGNTNPDTSDAAHGNAFTQSVSFTRQGGVWTEGVGLRLPYVGYSAPDRGAWLRTADQPPADALVLGGADPVKVNYTVEPAATVFAGLTFSEAIVTSAQASEATFPGVWPNPVVIATGSTDSWAAEGMPWWRTFDMSNFEYVEGWNTHGTVSGPPVALPFTPDFSGTDLPRTLALDTGYWYNPTSALSLAGGRLRLDGGANGRFFVFQVPGLPEVGDFDISFTARQSADPLASYPYNGTKSWFVGAGVYNNDHTGHAEVAGYANSSPIDYGIAGWPVFTGGVAITETQTGLVLRPKANRPSNYPVPGALGDPNSPFFDNYYDDAIGGRLAPIMAHGADTGGTTPTYGFRFQRSGQQFRWRVWDTSSGPEPAAWTKEAPLADYPSASGRPYLEFGTGYTGTIEVGALTVDGTAPAATPPPSTGVDVQVFDGASWFTAPLRVWDGAAWVTPTDLSAYSGSGWIQPAP